MANQTQFQFSVTLSSLHTLKTGEVTTSEKIYCNRVNWSVEVVVNEENRLNFRVICDANLSCRLSLAFEKVGAVDTFYDASTRNAPTTFSSESIKSKSFLYFTKTKSAASHIVTPNYFSEQHKCKVIVFVSDFMLTTTKERKFDDLTGRLQSFFLDDVTADVYVITDNNERIPAHKLMLMASSPVFKAMLTSKMSESVNNEIMISEVSSTVVRLFLSYLYGHQPESLNDNSITVDLLALAHKFEVQGLVTECETQLCESISVNNAVDLLLLSDTYTLPELKAKVFVFITNNISVVDEVGFLERITPPLTLDLLKYMSSKLIVNNIVSNK